MQPGIVLGTELAQEVMEMPLQGRLGDSPAPGLQSMGSSSSSHCSRRDLAIVAYCLARYLRHALIVGERTWGPDSMGAS